MVKASYLDSILKMMQENYGYYTPKGNVAEGEEEQALLILERDGYVKLIKTNVGIIKGVLLDTGKAFIGNDGYKAIESEKEEAKRERERDRKIQMRSAWISAITGAIFGIIGSIIIHLLFE